MGVRVSMVKAWSNDRDQYSHRADIEDNQLNSELIRFIEEYLFTDFGEETKKLEKEKGAEKTAGSFNLLLKWIQR